MGSTQLNVRTLVLSVYYTAAFCQVWLLFGCVRVCGCACDVLGAISSSVLACSKCLLSALSICWPIWIQLDVTAYINTFVFKYFFVRGQESVFGRLILKWTLFNVASEKGSIARMMHLNVNVKILIFAGLIFPFLFFTEYDLNHAWTMNQHEKEWT